MDLHNLCVKLTWKGKDRLKWAAGTVWLLWEVQQQRDDGSEHGTVVDVNSSWTTGTMWLLPGVQVLRALRMSHLFTCFTSFPGRVARLGCGRICEVL